MSYVYHSEGMHRYGKYASTFELLSKASALEDIPAVDVEQLGEERRLVVQTVSRLSRKANFRQQVLNAYGHRCAVTRMQLRLVDAAHILPVGAPHSIDDVRNGLALSPTCHRAFDNGLIFLDDRYVMRLNPDKEHFLRELNLIGGLQDFKANLGKILLPPDQMQWPNHEMIRKANRHRQISVA